MFEGLKAVLKRQPEGRISDDSLQSVISPVVITYRDFKTLHKKILIPVDFFFWCFEVSVKNKFLTNNSNLVPNLRKQAGSYLKKANMKTITTSDRGGGITEKIVEAVEETREKLLGLLEGDGNIGWFRLPNSGRLLCVTCNDKSYSKAGFCKIRNRRKKKWHKYYMWSCSGIHCVVSQKY